jgi:hypothetical protein
MNDYKQWSGKTRVRMLAKYKASKDKPSVGPCEICQQTKNTMHHAEDYGPTLEVYLDSLHSLCGHCHAMLHLRFRFPSRWNDYKEKVRQEGVQDFVPNMGKIFMQSNHWVDVPFVTHKQGNEWWEKLNTRRHLGEKE